MKKTVLLPLLLIAALAPAGRAGAAPAGPETNPIGTLRWLPDNTNESSQVPSGLSRLVVIYDRSLNSAGKASDLLTNGAFGVKFSTTSPEIRMKGHSSGVEGTQDAGLPSPALDEVFAGVHGDIRDGACSKAGTSSFAAAFTTTRVFFHAGGSPYQPQTGSGACEVVQSSTPVGSGFQTRVITYVPGFWIDVEWPEHSDPLDVTGGQALADLWYTAVYDTEAESGDFYETADSAGISDSVGSPGDYDITFAAAATPGGSGLPCGGLVTNQPGAPGGTYQRIEIQVPGGAQNLTVRLFPKLDWDLALIDPDNITKATYRSGHGPGFVETVTVPAMAGKWTIVACNFAGEPTVMGGVIIK